MANEIRQKFVVISVVAVISCLLPITSASSYYMITSSTCSVLTSTLYDSSGYIYGASLDYTTIGSIACTKTFSVSTLNSLSVRLIYTDFCPTSTEDKLEIFDGRYTSGIPTLIVTRYSNAGANVTSSSSGYLTFRLTSHKHCSTLHDGFKVSYSINRDNNPYDIIADAISLSIGAIVGISIAVLVVIVLGIVGCVCCCCAAGRSGSSGGQVHQTVIHQPAGAPGYPMGGQGYPMGAPPHAGGPGYPMGPPVQPYTGGPPVYPGADNQVYGAEKVKNEY